MPLRHQPVRAVEVGGDAFEELRPLDEPAGEARAFLLGDQDRYVRERPGPLRRAGGVVLAEVDPGVAEVLVAAGEARREFLRRHPGEFVDEGAPDRADAPLRVEEFVGSPGRRVVVGEQARDGVVGRRLLSVFLSQTESLGRGALRTCSRAAGGLRHQRIKGPRAVAGDLPVEGRLKDDACKDHHR